MSSTLALRAYEQLRAKFANGEFEPGAQLVNRSVARLVGMSVTPIREAVNRLASEGLVLQMPGAGAFVRRFTSHEFAQLYDVREAIEPVAAANAAALATPVEIAELEAVAAASFAVIREARRDANAAGSLAARWRHLDARFHVIVVEAARNPWLTKIVGDLRLLTAAFATRHQLRGFPDMAGAVRTWRDHRRLIRAIGDRDGARAATLMRAHIRAGRTGVFARLATAACDLPPSTVSAAPPTPARQAGRRGRRPGAKRARVRR